MTQTPPTERPLVTFALFAYNQEDYIREAIEGAFAQTYEPLEIILSDDCSSDRTFEIMQEMAAAYEGPHEVLLNRNESNLGLARHINALLEKSKGTLFSWNAGDDIALPDKMHELANPLMHDTEVTGSHSSVIEIDLKGTEVGRRIRTLDEQGLTLDDVIEKCASVVSQSHMFRKSAVWRFGKFEENLSNEGPPTTFRQLLNGGGSFTLRNL